MVTALDNNMIRLILKNRGESIERSAKRVNIWSSIPFISDIFWIRRESKKMQRKIVEISLIIKGAYFKYDFLLEKDKKYPLSEVIKDYEKFAQDFIDLLNIVQRATSKSSKYSFFSTLKKNEDTLIETLDTLYDLILLFKKVNQRTPIATSELAKTSAEISSYTLHKVLSSD